MKYIRVKWNHTHKDEPVLLYSELDTERWEKRKVEEFADGHCGYASADESGGSTRLGEKPIPTLMEIASESEFEPAEITKEEFEEAWTKRKRKASS
jgi:hypothetical protein